MSAADRHTWPIFVKDRFGHDIYLTQERWEHALGPPGMDGHTLNLVLETLRKGTRRQDAFDRSKYKYRFEFANLLRPYTHVVVAVKFGWRGSPPTENNFVLTAYLIEKW